MCVCTMIIGLLPLIAAAASAILALLGVMRAEQVRIGVAREFSGTGYSFAQTPTAGAQTMWPNEFISGLDSLEDIETKQLKVRGQQTGAAQREVFQLIELKHKVEDSFQFAVQDGLWFAKTLGFDAMTGTFSGASTTLNGATTVGATAITLTSGAGIANGDFIQIETAGSGLAEIRKVSSGGGTASVVLDQGLTRAHANTVAVNRLDPTAPIVHTMTPLDTSPFPTSVLEVNYLDATSLSLYLEGLATDSLSISGGEADILMGTANLMGSKAVKNVGALSVVPVSTVQPYKFTQAPTFTYFGSTIARLQDWTASFNNNGKLKFYHGSAAPFPYEYLHGPATYTLETTVIPTDTTFFDVLKNAGGQSQGALACTILYTRGTNDTLQIAFTNGWLKKAPHSIPEEVEVPVKLTIEPRNVVVTVTQTPLSSQYAVWV